MLEGYHLCGIIGESCNILKFCYEKTKVPKSCVVLHKHLDEETDALIERMKIEKAEILCQNNHYIIFGIPSGEADGSKSEMMVKMQSKLLGIPIKKSAALISILLILSVISLVLKILLIDKRDYIYRLRVRRSYISLLLIEV